MVDFSEYYGQRLCSTSKTLRPVKVHMLVVPATPLNNQALKDG